MNPRHGALLGLAVAMATLMLWSGDTASSQPGRLAEDPTATATPAPVGENHPFVLWVGACQVSWWLHTDPWLHSVYLVKGGVRTDLIPNANPAVAQPLPFNMGDVGSVRWVPNATVASVSIRGVRYDKPWNGGPYNGEAVTFGFTYSVARHGVLLGPVERQVPGCGPGATTTPATATPITPTPATATPITPTPATATPITPTPATATPITPTPATATPITPTPATATPITPTPATATPITPTPATATPGTPTPATATPITPTPATATPTPSPTPVIYVPGPYLPRPLPCVRFDYVDVALVLDMSTSMLRPTASGAIKRDATLQAAREFVELMSLTPDPVSGRRDQVAVVWFNDNTGLEQALTSDRAAILGALDRLPDRTAQGTRLDLAFLAGADALSSPQRQAVNQPVMILLTDGLPNRVPTPVPGGSQHETVVAAAAAAKARGIQVYTIGVGRPDAPDLIDRVDPVLLAACASSADMSFLATDAEALSEVYRRIARTFCADPTVPRNHRIFLPIYYWTNDPDARRVFPSGTDEGAEAAYSR